MKYVKTFESFRNNKNKKYEPVNEEFLGAIGNFFSKMFKRAKENVRKTEGGKEIEAIYKKYLKLIDDAIVKQTGLKLDIEAVAVKESKIFEAEVGAEVAEEGAVAEEGETTDKPVETEKKPVVDAKILTQKNDILKKIIEQMKGMASKEMDNVLKKHGGGAENPQLQIIINAKKDQFTLDVLNAEIAALEKSGNPEAKKLLSAKQAEAKTWGETIKKWWVKFEKTGKKPNEGSKFNEPLELGKEVVYKRKKFNEENWKKLIDKISGDSPQWIDRSEADESPMKEMIEKREIGILKISNIDGDKVELKGDKVISKTIGDILLKIHNKEGDSSETKESDTENKPTTEEENTKEETPKEETK